MEPLLKIIEEEDIEEVHLTVLSIYKVAIVRFFIFWINFWNASGRREDIM